MPLSVASSTGSNHGTISPDSTSTSFNPQRDEAIMSTQQLDNNYSQKLPELRTTAKKYGRWAPREHTDIIINTSAIGRAFPGFSQGGSSDDSFSIELGRGAKTRQRHTPTRVPRAEYSDNVESSYKAVDTGSVKILGTSQRFQTKAAFLQDALRNTIAKKENIPRRDTGSHKENIPPPNTQKPLSTSPYISHASRTSSGERRSLTELHAQIADDTTGSIIGDERPATITFKHQNTRFSSVKAQTSHANNASPLRTHQTTSASQQTSRANDASSYPSHNDAAAYHATDALQITSHAENIPPSRAYNATDAPQIASHADNVFSLHTYNAIREASHITDASLFDTSNLTNAPPHTSHPANVSTKRHEVEGRLVEKLRTASDTPSKLQTKPRANYTAHSSTPNPTQQSFIIPHMPETSQVTATSFNKGTGAPFLDEEQDIYGNIDFLADRVDDLESKLAQANDLHEQQAIEIRHLKRQASSQGELFKLKVERDQAVIQLSDSLSQIDRLEQQIHSFKQQRSESLKQNDQIAQKMRVFEQQQSFSQIERSRIRTEMNQLLTKNEELEHRLTESLIKIEQLEVEVREGEVQFEAYKEESEKIFTLELNKQQSMNQNERSENIGENDTGAFSIKSARSTHSHRRHHSDATVHTTRRRRNEIDDMTSAFIIPDISSNHITAEATHPSLSTNARQVLDGLCKHSCTNCTVCTRIASFDTKNRTKAKVVIPKPVPVSERMPETTPYEDEPTLRPSVEPSLALATIIKGAEDELAHLKMKHTRIHTAYTKHDASLGMRKRKALKKEMDELTSQIEQKSDQVYGLYDVLEAKGLGLDMTEDLPWEGIEEDE